MTTIAGRPSTRQLARWGLDPAWSRIVEFATVDGEQVQWHVLDNGAEPVLGTLVCTHGNPTWSYIWRDLLATAPVGWRVVAVDQTGMGFSSRGEGRVLAQRIDELVAFCQAHTTGSLVMAAHDWGGPVTIGATARLDVRALVLTDTAVALPDGVRVPPLIRATRAAIGTICETTPAFVAGTARMTDRRHRDALKAPYRTRAHRHAVAEFVADIPVAPRDRSWGTLLDVAQALDAVTAPVLLAWGGRDPVFHERFLADLVHRVPHAQVQVFPQAGHLVTLDAPVAELTWQWLAALDGDPVGGVEAVEVIELDAAAPGVAGAVAPDVANDAPVVGLVGDDVGFVPVTAALEAHRSDPAEAYRGPGGTRSWRELAAHAHAVAEGLVADGLQPGDRVALLVPPSADCLIAAYGVWLAGGVVVAVDSQIGLPSMRRLLRGATVQWSIGTARTVRLARTVGLTPGARFVVVPEAPTAATAPAGAAEPSHLPVLEAGMPAAVVHTSGATGPAKPVAYTHSALAHQRDAILAQFPMGPFTTSFAPFLLLSPALGLLCSLPDDITPGAMDFDAFAAASAGTTAAWLSPAAARRIIETAAGRTLAMDLVMLAGAPVTPGLVDGMAAITGGEVRAPYGMTEALPLTDGTTPTAPGPHGGTCTGRPLEGVQIVIAALDAELPVSPAPSASATVSAPTDGWGEILAAAPWMRTSYDRRWGLTRDATVVIDGVAYHRTGDVGYLDDTGRLFQLGRRIHVITTPAGPLPCVVPEQQVLAATGQTAAAVGVGPDGTQALVVVIDADGDLALADLATTAAVRAACTDAVGPVAAVLTGRLPVDVRHRTKIDRVAVAADATDLLAGR